MARNFVAASSQGLTFSGTPKVTAFPFTMSCWFKPTSAVNSFAMALTGPALGIGTSGYCGIVLSNTGTVRCQIDDGAGSADLTPDSGAVTLTNGTWYRLTLVFNSSTDRRLYINNTKTTNNSPMGFPSNLSAISVGELVTYWGSGSATNFCDAAIADAAMWSSALADIDVAQLVLGYSAHTVRVDKLENYWPLTGHGSTETDYTGAQGLTVVNTALASAHPRIFNPHSKRGRRFTTAAGGATFLPAWARGSNASVIGSGIHA